MAKMLSQFNAKESDKLGDFTPIPAGQYVAQITKSELKQTKDEQGHYLQLLFQVLGGEYNGRTIFERLNIQNRNSQTVEIAQKTLATICEICNVDVLEDSEQLHNTPMMIKVTVRPAKAQYSEQNEIKGYQEHNGSAIEVPAEPGAATLPSAAAKTGEAKPAGKTPPWKS